MIINGLNWHGGTGDPPGGLPDGKFAAEGREVQEGIQEGSGEEQEEAQAQEVRIMSGQ
jgi:hypothetical protein